MASSTASFSWYPNNQDPTTSGATMIAPPHQMQQQQQQQHHSSYHSLQSSNDIPMEQQQRLPHVEASTNPTGPAQAMVPVHYNGSSTSTSNGPISTSNNGSPVGRPPSSASTSSTTSFHTAHTASTVHTAHTAHTSNTSHSMHPQHQHQHQQPHHFYHQQHHHQHPGMNYHSMHHQAGGFTAGGGARSGPGPSANQYVHPQHVQAHGHPQSGPGLVRPTGRYPMPQRNAFGQQHPVRPVPRMPRQQQPHFPPQGHHHPSQHHNGAPNPGYSHQAPPMMGQHPLYPPSSSHHHAGGPSQQQQQGSIPTLPSSSQQSVPGAQPLRSLPPANVGNQDHPNGTNHSNAQQHQGYNYPPKHHSGSHQPLPAGRSQGLPQGPYNMHPERSPTLSGTPNGYLPHPHQPMNPNYQQHHGLHQGNSSSMGMNQGGEMPYDMPPYTQQHHGAGGGGIPTGPYGPSMQHHHPHANSGGIPPPPFMLRPEEQHSMIPHMQEPLPPQQASFQHPQYARRPSYDASPETTADAHQAISPSPSPPPPPPSSSASGFLQDSSQQQEEVDCDDDDDGTSLQENSISSKVDRPASVGSLESLNRVMAQNNIAGRKYRSQLNSNDPALHGGGSLGERGTNTTNNVTGKLPLQSSNQASGSGGGVPTKNKEDATADAASILLQLCSGVQSEGGNSENENPQATAVLMQQQGSVGPQNDNKHKNKNLSSHRSDVVKSTMEGDGAGSVDSSSRETPDHHDYAPDLTSEPSSDSIETMVDSEFPCPVPKNYPTRLCMPCDNSKLNTLHCFLRSELLEIFVVEKSRNKSPTHSPGSSVGRVGLRCVHCAMVRKERDDRDEAPMAVFYPKSVAEIYRLVTSWQRCHLRKCRNLPPTVRSRWQMLRDNDKSRGKTHYWVTSAKRLGLVDCNSRAGGVRFAADFDASKLEGCVMSSDSGISTLTLGDSSEPMRMEAGKLANSDDAIEAEPTGTAVSSDSTATSDVGSQANVVIKIEDKSQLIVKDDDMVDTSNDIKMEEDGSQAIVKDEGNTDSNNDSKMEEDASQTIVEDEDNMDSNNGSKMNEGIAPVPAPLPSMEDLPTSSKTGDDEETDAHAVEEKLADFQDASKLPESTNSWAEQPPPQQQSGQFIITGSMSV